MASLPATPPAERPKGKASWRFEETSAPCEWAEDYRPGVYHPVNLGNTFHDGAYRVLRKLGYGSYSTVWLAVDTRNLKYVSLKIMIASASTTNTELDILEHLSKRAAKDPNSRHLTVLLDTFIHEGPNGKHRCLVFEPMGTSAASLVRQLPENQPALFGKRQRYPKWMAKNILLHCLRGLAFLHTNGVAHGDVQPGNLLFAINDINSAKENELKQNETDTEVHLRRIDGKKDKWTPTNLYLRQSLHEYVGRGPDLCVKLSDLGSAFWSANPPKDTLTPLALRAPELILHQPIDSSIDIWSFGCLMFEFLMGRTLFACEDTDDEHLSQLNDVIGPLPDFIMDAWPRARKWYDADCNPLQPDEDEGEPFIYDSLENLFADTKPEGIDDEESTVVCSLIKRILDYNPSKRPSAAELLKHPWFTD
ncbi:uncharacterized protein K452DRAFT_327966 [Aplosporella prunicola CBS 121167]|uniref:non-specific serine/threonine protein kinase n=1 Tax=Aplosporella prunicola CBS 121167 TaxID=1176127 RepID=A0A6A6B5T1_9PEZI|nr:uncharacterized protein K452DRAFT_327966 [Aplosporella prunicola CBS 121167]KAF2139479.1 hypothetical protein K452DRAFT_327966 [Aplosporella prunicola CBS 121167]